MMGQDQYTAHAIEDAVDDQGVQNCIDPPSGQRFIHPDSQPADSSLQQCLKPGSDDIEGQKEHQCHNSYKGGDGSVFSCEECVDPAAALVLFALRGRTTV